MSTLDDWKLAASTTYVTDMLYPYRNAEDLNQLNKRILALIDLVKEMSEELEKMESSIQESSEPHYELPVLKKLREWK